MGFTLCILLVPVAVARCMGVHGAEGIGVCQGVVMPGGAAVQAICWWGSSGGCSWLVGWLDVWVPPCPPSAVAGPTTVVFPSP